MSDNSIMLQNIVNETVESETEAMRRRIMNLEFALVELITHIETGDPAQNSAVVQYARSVLEGEFEE